MCGHGTRDWDNRLLTSVFRRYMDEHKKLPQPPEGSKYAVYK